MRFSRLGVLGCALVCGLAVAGMHCAPHASARAAAPLHALTGGAWRSPLSPLDEGEHQRVLNGVRLYYRVTADTPAHRAPVLFLHGGPGYNSYSFSKLMGGRLEKHHRMVYLDQRGCGRSERPWDDSYSVAVMVEDLEALRQELGLERWVLMGHSFGATLALEYAARYPGRMAGVVYVSGLSDARGSFATWRQELERRHPERLARVSLPEEASDYERVMRAMRELEARDFFNQMQFHDATFRQQQELVDAESGLRNTGELSRALFSSELLTYRFAVPERVTTPVLVIGGRYDTSIGLESLKSLAQRLPHATFLEYERSGHYPYLEEADRFEQDVTRFLASLP